MQNNIQPMAQQYSEKNYLNMRFSKMKYKKNYIQPQLYSEK